MTELTRKEVREAYANSGLTKEPLTFVRMNSLRDAINKHMLSPDYFDGTYHMKHHSNIKMHSNGCVSMRCQAHYFDDREAVTFNRDGFVGFAGWADDGNVQPVLRGFMDWIASEQGELA